MKKLFFIYSLLIVFLLIGCKKKDDNPTSPSGNNDIPTDPVNVTVPAPTINNIQPTATFTSPASNPSRIQINLTGLLDPTTGNPITLTYNSSNPSSSNIFITEDGVTQGLKVTKVGSGTTLTADVCFLVDNSGSMYEEADSIAAGIIKFANYLQASGLDVKFAVVGQGYSGGEIAGGINFTTATNISNFLNRTGYTGTSRTYGFSGTDSASLATKAYSFATSVYGENLVKAASFADTFYTWRSGAQRIFIAFTDEGTQPGSSIYKTTYACAKFSGKATIHTVFSVPNSYWTGSVPDTSKEWNNYTDWNASYERPWKLSECTGGTIKFIHSTSYDLNLLNLPVTGALSNSYLVEYIGNNNNTQHTVVITIITTTADGKKEYKVTY